jgi:hypothetical protein
VLLPAAQPGAAIEAGWAQYHGPTLRRDRIEGNRGAMKQSRLMSLVEAIANVAVGYGVAVATQLLVFPLFGLIVSFGENLAIGGVFTVVSLIRAYVLRRLFETMRDRAPS